MHVIHAIKGMVTEPDCENGHKIQPIAQKAFRLKSTHSIEKLGKNSYEVLFSLEGIRNNWAAEYNIIRHMDLYCRYQHDPYHMAQQSKNDAKDSRLRRLCTRPFQQLFGHREGWDNAANHNAFPGITESR